MEKEPKVKGHLVITKGLLTIVVWQKLGGKIQWVQMVEHLHLKHAAPTDIS